MNISLTQNGICFMNKSPKVLKPIPCFFAYPDCFLIESHCRFILAAPTNQSPVGNKSFYLTCLTTDLSGSRDCFVLYRSSR